MSNTRKTKPRDPRLIEMSLMRKQEKLRVRLLQQRNQQRAAHARKVTEEKTAEVQERLGRAELEPVLDMMVDVSASMGWEFEGPKASKSE